MNEYQSRVEQILSGTFVGNPQSRVEALLMALIAGGVVAPGEGAGALRQSISVTKNVGGVTSGQTIAAGTSFETVFRRILSPNVNPTFTPPTASLKSNASSMIFGIDEPIGSVRFDLTFDQGKIVPEFGTSGKRSGPASSYTIDGQTGQTVSINMDDKMPNGERQVTITGVVAYQKGEQPKNSSGENYSTPLPAGSVSDYITFERKPYIYSNKNGSFERMPISQYNSSPIEIALRNEDHPNEATIALPSRATSIETWDALEKEWEDISWEWLEEQITIDGRTYWKYTDNRGYRAGERQLKFKW